MIRRYELCEDVVEVTKGVFEGAAARGAETAQGPAKAGQAIGLAKKAQKGAKGVTQMTPKFINLDALVKKGQAPRSIRKFDKARDFSARHTPVQHVYFKDGSTLRKDGV